MATETVRVIYRADRTDGEVTAFLDGSANPGNIVCYAHIGQHGEASLDYYRECTRPATPTEFAALHRELTAVYSPECRLAVRKRLWRNVGVF